MEFAIQELREIMSVSCWRYELENAAPFFDSKKHVLQIVPLATGSGSHACGKEGGANARALHMKEMAHVLRTSATIATARTAFRPIVLVRPSSASVQLVLSCEIERRAGHRTRVTGVVIED